MKIYIAMILILFASITSGWAASLDDYQSFSVAFEQEGQAVPMVDHTVTLERKEFAIVITFHGFNGKTAILIKPSYGSQFYDKAQNDLPLTELTAPGLGMAEARTTGKSLSLNDRNSVHYWFHDPEKSRFHQVLLNDGDLTAKRYIARLYSSEHDSIPIAECPADELFLVFIRPAGGAVVQQEYVKIVLLPGSGEKPTLVQLKDRHILYGQLLREAQQAFNQKEYPTAIEKLTQAIALDSTDYKAYGVRAITFKALQKKVEALQDINQAILLNPDGWINYTVRAELQANLDDSITDYTRAIEISTRQNQISYIPYLARARLYVQKLKLDLALEDLNKSLQLNSSDKKVFALRAVIYAMRNQTAEAIEDVTKCISLDPHDYEALMIRSSLYQVQGLHQLALADINQALVINPWYEQAYPLRAAIYKTTGQYDQAIADYSRALQRDAANHVLLYSRGSVYQAKGQQKEAIADFNKIIALRPSYAAAYYAKGISYKELGNKQAAIEAFEQFLAHALPIDPNIMTAKKWLQELNKELGVAA